MGVARMELVMLLQVGAAVPEEEKKRYEEKASRLPVPPPTAMVYFLVDFRAECGEVFPGSSNEDVVYSAMECWEDVKPSVKQDTGVIALCNLLAVLVAIDYLTKCGVGICGACAAPDGRRICVDGPFIARQDAH